MTSAIETHRFTNTRDLRYGEVFLVTDQGIDMYNTTGLNDCPEQLWNALDPAKLQADFRVHKVLLNGPHWWVMDTLSVQLGETLDFQGLQARWIGRLPVAMGQSSHGFDPYQVFRPKKAGVMEYAAGQLVYQLVSPDGDAFTMQAYGRVVDNALTLQDLETLGERLKLAPGWEYRARRVDEDLKLSLDDATVHAVSDDLRNIYNRT